MEDGERTKISCGRFLLLLSQGVIMGIGAVLPGISGGVLCVIFGIYYPTESIDESMAFFG